MIINDLNYLFDLLEVIFSGFYVRGRLFIYKIFHTNIETAKNNCHIFNIITII